MCRLVAGDTVTTSTEEEETTTVTSSLALAASRPLLQAVVRCLVVSLDTSQLAAATLDINLAPLHTR